MVVENPHTAHSNTHSLRRAPTPTSTTSEESSDTDSSSQKQHGNTNASNFAGNGAEHDKEVLFEDVQQQLSLILGGSIDDYSRDTTLVGIDSLSLMELIGWINNRTSQEVTASFISESLTPGDIHKHLCDHPLPSKDGTIQHIQQGNLERSSNMVVETPHTAHPTMHSLQSAFTPTSTTSEESSDTDSSSQKQHGNTNASNFAGNGAEHDKEVLFEDVQQQLSLILGGSMDDYSRDTTLVGIDSLSLMELIGWINNRTSQEVTASFISESLTPGDIYEYLCDHPLSPNNHVGYANQEDTQPQTASRPADNEKKAATVHSHITTSLSKKSRMEIQTVNGCKSAQIQLGRTLDKIVFDDFDAALHAKPDLIIITQQHPQVFNEGLPLTQMKNDSTEIAKLIDLFVNLCTNLTSYQGLVVCYVNGIVRGGGMAFLGLADVCYCTAESTFGFPEVEHNMIPAVVSSVLSKRTKNSGRFNSYLISGKSFDSSVAISLGLCDEVMRKVQWNESHQLLMKRASLCAFMKKEDVLNSTDPRSMGTAMGAFLTSRDEDNAQIIKARQTKEDKILDLSWNGQIAILAMNDTNGKNTLSKEMAAELREINKKLQGARCIVLHSSLSNIFHVGASPSHFRSMKGKPVCMSAATIRSLYEPWLAFYNLNIPVVAIVHGKVYGGGLPIALWADYRVAVSDVDAHFGNISRGMSPAAQLSALLKESLAPGVLMDLYLGNKHWGAQKLHLEGLVQQITETKAEALAAAMAMANFIALQEPHGIKNTFNLIKSKQRKELINLEAWLIAEAAVQGHVFTQKQASSNQSFSVPPCPPMSHDKQVSDTIHDNAPVDKATTTQNVKQSEPTKYGIIAMAPYTSNFCITNTEMVSGGLTPSKFQQKAVSVWDVNEDAISMALNATKKLLEIMKANKIDHKLIRRIEVGSESNMDMAKSIKSHIMQLFPNNKEMEGVDNVAACYGGTAALLNTMNWLQRDANHNKDDKQNIAYGIVIATDTAYMDKEQICWQGCGAMAMLVGPNPSIEILPQTVTYMDDGHDFYQPRFSTTLSPIVEGRESMEAYLEALKYTSTKMKERYGFSLTTVDHVAVHGGLHKGVIDRAMNAWAKWEKNISRSVVLTKYEPSTKHAELLGAQYTASLYFNLHSVIEHSCEKTDRPYSMLLFSYGSGCSSTMFTAKVVKKPIGFEELQPQLLNRIQLSYQQTCDVLDRHLEIRKPKYNQEGESRHSLLPSIPNTNNQNNLGLYQRAPDYLVSKQYCQLENVSHENQ